MCVRVCVFMCVWMPPEARRGWQIPWMADMWVLRTELRSSARETSTLISLFEITIQFYCIYKI